MKVHKRDPARGSWFYKVPYPIFPRCGIFHDRRRTNLTNRWDRVTCRACLKYKPRK